MEALQLAGSAAEYQKPLKPKNYSLVFTGSGSEYFRIWIVNLVLTVLTLGIFSPWAKVRKLRYLYGNTFLDGSAFEFHGEPLKILKGRLIALCLLAPLTISARFSPFIAAAFLIVFAIALPFIVVTSRRFKARNSSWRHIRFDFSGTYKEAAFVYLGLAVLTGLTLGLLFPYWMYRKQRFLLERSRFGASEIQFGGTKGQFYLAYLFGFLLAVIGTMALAFYGTWLLGPAFASVFSGRDPMVAVNYPGQFILLWVLWIYLCYFVYAVVQARQLNATYGHLRIADHETESEIAVGELGGIYLNNLLFMTLTFGLYAPWAKIKLVHYQIESLSIKSRGTLDNLAADEHTSSSAVGSEAADFLDLDFSL